MKQTPTSSRVALALISIAVVLCVGVYATLRASGHETFQDGPLVPKANYQFIMAQPVQFPGYASPSAMISAQVIAIQGTWATIQYAAGPNKTAYTATINTHYIVVFARQP